MGAKNFRGEEEDTNRVCPSGRNQERSKFCLLEKRINKTKVITLFFIIFFNVFDS